MRILLAQNSLYYPSHGGGDKSNRLLIEALAARGHTCRGVTRIARFGPAGHEAFLEELKARSVAAESSGRGVVIFLRAGVEVHTVTNRPSLRAYFAEQAGEFDPDVIIASTDDPAQVLLEPALEARRARVVYLARATLALPFGPDSAFPSTPKTEMLRAADGVVGVSGYVADYIRRWSGIPAVSLPISLLESGPAHDLGRFDNEFVTLVNPCAVKGIAIFLALAERFPQARFAAVPTWGTNQADRLALDQHANVTILPPADNVDDILARTRVLLVPSLWAEARSRIVVEAMLRGVPVIASDIGGIPEAKLGVDYLLPVRPIEKYQERVDEQMVPVAEVPAQDIGPWENALRRLISDREHFRQLSRESREAALRYAENLSVEPFERLLKEVVQKPQPRPSFAGHVSAIADPLEKLSPDKRRLLALRLRKPTAAGNWFSSLDERPGAKVRLFCFPHAGAGASAFRGWRLPAEIAVCPVMLPGRESRIAETPFDSMAPLVEALSQSVGPHLERPFVFFGHSMGAVIAFELARSLRRTGRPLPLYLLVSGARAPQFRRGHVPPPPPSDTELLDQLRHLDGTPREVLGNDELMRMMLPAMRADTTLYRNYIYVEEPPLACPIRAYGGSDDPNISRAQLEAWAAETTADFKLRMFPGGHFYLNSNQAEFLAALAEDLQPLTVRG